MRLHHLAWLSFLILSVSAKTGSETSNLDGPDLICHTSDPKDCYPKIFVPTNEFQIVHNDQAIPKGLHVRMSMQTGQKEAKLVDPNDDRPVNAVEVTQDKPVNAVEVLPDESVRDEVPLGIELESVEGQAEKLLDDMRKAKAAKAGVVKPPIGSARDREVFEKNVGVVRDYVENPSKYSGDLTNEVYDALEQLEDLCHDIYWGQELMKNRLTALVPSAHIKDSEHSLGSLASRSQLSRLFATALQNNAAALDILEGLYVSPESLGDPPVNYLPWALKLMEDSVNDISTLPRPIGLISAMLSADRFHRDFIRINGPQRVKDVLAAAKHRADSEDARKEALTVSQYLKRVHLRVRNLLSDHYIGKEGEQRISLWGRETEKSAERLDWHFDDPKGRTKTDLDALCVNFGKMFDVWHDVSTPPDWGQDPPEGAISLQYEPNVCKSWRIARAHAGDKSEL